MSAMYLKRVFTLPFAFMIAVSACSPNTTQISTSYQSLSDDDLMILFTKSVGAMEHDYRNPPHGIEEIEREVTRRKLASLSDLDKIRMAGRYSDQGEAYVGMRSQVLLSLRGEPYRIEQIGNTKKWKWGDGFIASPNRYKTRDYVCVRNNIIVGVRYTWCDYGDCSSNKERGEDC